MINILYLAGSWFGNVTALLIPGVGPLPEDDWVSNRSVGGDRTGKFCRKSYCENPVFVDTFTFRA
jgi:hypothetical protein